MPHAWGSPRVTEAGNEPTGTTSCPEPSELFDPLITCFRSRNLPKDLMDSGDADNEGPLAGTSDPESEWPLTPRDEGGPADTYARGRVSDRDNVDSDHGQDKSQQEPPIPELGLRQRAPYASAKGMLAPGYGIGTRHRRMVLNPDVSFVSRRRARRTGTRLDAGRCRGTSRKFKEEGF